MTLHLKLPQKFPAGRSFNDDRGTSSLRGDEHITSIQNSRNAMPAGFFGSRKKSSEGKTTSWIPKPEFHWRFFLGGGSVSLTVYHCLVEFRQNDNFWISLNLNSIGDFLRDGFSSTKCLGFVGISY